VIGIGLGVRVVVAAQPVDLRRGHDGLITLVRTLWLDDPYSGTLFVFFGRRRDRVKVLYFSEGGFVVYYKRLEQGRFFCPKVPADASRILMDAATLAMILAEIDASSATRIRGWAPPLRKFA
jgi:transposase